MHVCMLHFFEADEASSSATLSLYLGVILGTALCGLTLSQGLTYARRNTDSRTLRIFVYLEICFDVLVAIATILSGYFLLVSRSNQSLRQSYFVIFTSLVSNATIVVALLAHVFMAHRLYLLYPPAASLVAVCITIASISFCFGASSSALMCVMETRDTRRAAWYYLSGLNQAFDAFVNVLIAAALSYVLWDMKRNGTRPGVRGIMNQLIIFVVNRGVLLTFGQGLYAVLWFADPFNPRYMVIWFALSKLYTNTMLAMLNARDELRKKADEVSHTTTPGLRFALERHTQQTRTATDIDILEEQTEGCHCACHSRSTLSRSQSTLSVKSQQHVEPDVMTIRRI